MIIDDESAVGELSLCSGDGLSVLHELGYARRAGKGLAAETEQAIIEERVPPRAVIVTSGQDINSNVAGKPIHEQGRAHPALYNVAC